MTNRLAVYLGILLIAAVFADFLLLDTQSTIFLGKKLVELIDYIAVWR